MATVISPEITEKSPWWIPRQRYYELKHFCLQYPDWKIQLRMIDGIQHQAELTNMPKNRNSLCDTTGEMAINRARLSKRIDMVERAAREADADLCDYILKGITEGVSYHLLQFKLGMPYNRNDYYETYRKFFYILDKYRD
ncbi:MAG: hypothetical protein E7576_06915 [Ruminococcaceae bacterium]|nr:hypothetical protein [Oscillospiraceae bacterium]